MFEKPRLSDAKISACLQQNYGLTMTELTFLPLGHDAYAGVYRVQATETYFLKVKQGLVYEASISLPRYLKHQGIEQIVAPLPTITGELWGRVDDFTLILYPFIEGQSGWDREMSDRQWIEFGTVVKQLHMTQLPADLLDQIPQETFIPPARYPDMMRQIQAKVSSGDYEDAFQQELAAFWNEHEHEISLIVERSEQLGCQIKSSDFVLCHADIHVGNLLLTPEGKLFVVDWDQPILAPKERDLMFTLRGAFVTQQREADLFVQGYGPVEVDPLVMAYYRYERLMEDLAEFAAQIFLLESNEETKQDSVYLFKAQFEADSQVEMAHHLDHYRK
jgi:spectinomycin phosphotransferase